MLDLYLKRPWPSVNGHRQTWVQTRGLRVKGLASARRRSGPAVWEIDYLLLSPDILHEEMDLLHSLVLGAGRCGVDRVFLRLGSDSRLLDAVRSAGFYFYMQEYLYRLDRSDGGFGPGTRPSDSAVYPRSPANEYGVFQLYNSSYPLHVREAEGQTLEEWRQAQERGWGKRGGKEYVLLRDDSVAGWARVAGRRKNGYMDLMVGPEAADLNGLLDAAAVKLRRCSTLWCIASEFQMPLRRVLEERGFQMVEEYTTAVRHVTAKVKRPSLVPVGVK